MHLSWHWPQLDATVAVRLQGAPFQVLSPVGEDEDEEETAPIAHNPLARRVLAGRQSLAPPRQQQVCARRAAAVLALPSARTRRMHPHAAQWKRGIWAVPVEFDGCRLFALAAGCAPVGGNSGGKRPGGVS